MGFAKTLYLYVECIRKQSNIILCGESENGKKIIAALKTVDFSMSESRQVLNGFAYVPPLNAGDKINPLTVEDVGNAFMRSEIRANLIFGTDESVPYEHRIFQLVNRINN